MFNSLTNLVKRKISERKALSVMFPILKPLIVKTRTTLKKIEYLRPSYNLSRSVVKSNFRIYKHKSLLRRKLGNADPSLQEQKVKNLELAANAFNDLVIEPNTTFSFWKYLGEPRYDKGFVDGMLIDNGKVIIGLGGGLCQSANLLYWLCLHSPLSIKEHHHHQVDIFPDSGRVLPFGSGAGVLYNYGDLQFENKTDSPITIKMWLDDKFLQGEIWAQKDFNLTYKVAEKDHYFYRRSDGQVYRTNKLYRTTMQRQGGIVMSEDLVTFNDSKVLYEVDPSLLKFDNTNGVDSTSSLEITPELSIVSQL